VQTWGREAWDFVVCLINQHVAYLLELSFIADLLSGRFIMSPAMIQMRLTATTNAYNSNRVGLLPGVRIFYRIFTIDDEEIVQANIRADV
jgi:hypothetical protein